MPVSPWINEGPLRVRFREEHGHIVRELNQPSRDAIMDATQDERRDGRRQSFLGGYKVGSIPLVDLERVIEKYPEFRSKEASKEDKKKALVRFSNDPEMQQYLVRKA